ncbi:MAG: oxidoreductase [Salinisphaeraceae bacterium]|nr:oxidoreductase [Salinisphaeraceae bacterium]
MSKGFTADDVARQDGRTFAITGANTGLGFETARVLARQGARVLLACRSEDKAQAAMDRIRTEVPEADLAFVPLDQANLASVNNAAEQIGKEPRLDVLVNNAGIMTPPRQLTQDGFESQFGVNHLGTFALTGLLLTKLAEQPGARVVVTSSIAHKGAPLYFDDINAERGYNRVKRYQQSKLANLLFMHELHRRLQAAGSTTLAVACHPGVAGTELSRYIPGGKLIGAPLLNTLLNSPAKGAWPTLMAATADSVESGQYYGPSKRREMAGPARLAKSSSKSRNPELMLRLWEMSVDMTGVDPGI